MKNEVVGICRICKKQKELTFEHIPPRSAFNKTVRYYDIPSDEYWSNFVEYAINKKPFGKKVQGGFGKTCLCSECNTFLGSKYVRDYKKLAEGCLSAMNQYPTDLHFEFTIPEDINKRNILKQAIAIFICCNETTFTDAYPELLDFIVNENSCYLPERYKICMYLNYEGSPRNGKLTFSATDGIVCEFSFIPLGFVLIIDSPKPTPLLYDITFFKYHTDEKIRVALNKFPTYSPLPLDYRTKDEILNSK